MSRRPLAIAPESTIGDAPLTAREQALVRALKTSIVRSLRAATQRPDIDTVRKEKDCDTLSGRDRTLSQARVGSQFL